MKNKTVCGLLVMAAVITLAYLVLAPHNAEITPPPYIQQIDSLRARADSLDNLLAQRPARDTIYKSKVRTITQYLEAKTDSVKQEPLTGKVSYFSAKTGADSLLVNADSVTLVPQEQIWKADSIFIRQEAQEKIIPVLNTAIASKDTTLRLQATRIRAGDDLNSALTMNLYLQTKQTQRQKRLTTIFKITSFAFALLSLLK